MKTWNTIPTLDLILKEHPTIEGFLFDMDGTIFNSELYHAKAVREALIELNPDYDFPKAKTLSMKCIEELSILLFLKILKSEVGYQRLHLRQFPKEEKSNPYFLDTHSDDFFSPQMKNLLDEIYQSDLKLGTVTNSERIVTFEHLGQHSLIEIFDTIVTREDTETPKAPSSTLFTRM